jgi:hypothetical protein
MNVSGDSDLPVSLVLGQTSLYVCSIYVILDFFLNISWLHIKYFYQFIQKVYSSKFKFYLFKSYLTQLDFKVFSF